MMRILANENFPGDAVQALRSRGHDVTWIRTTKPGMVDRDVLALATAEGRLLITFDKDFGELAFRSNLPSDSGIVLFRIAPSSPSLVASVAVSALESRDDLTIAGLAFWVKKTQWSDENATRQTRQR